MANPFNRNIHDVLIASVLRCALFLNLENLSRFPQPTAQRVGFSLLTFPPKSINSGRHLHVNPRSGAKKPACKCNCMSSLKMLSNPVMARQPSFCSAAMTATSKLALHDQIRVKTSGILIRKRERFWRRSAPAIRERYAGICGSRQPMNFNISLQRLEFQVAGDQGGI